MAKKQETETVTDFGAPEVVVAPEVVTTPKPVEVEVVTDEALPEVKLNKNGAVPGQPVTLLQCVAASRRQKTPVIISGNKRKSNK